MMMNCDRATMLMSQAQERTLTAMERGALVLHKSMCRGCHNFERQLPTLREAARRYADLPDQALSDGMESR
jgi:cytochrome c551/c552